MTTLYVGIDPHEDGFTVVFWDVGEWCVMERYQHEGLQGQDKWKADLDRLVAGFTVRLMAYVKQGYGPVICIEIPHTTGQIAGDELFRTAHVAGYLRGALEAFYKVHPIRRRDVKAILLGAPSGNDAQVTAVVKSDIGQPGTKKTPGPTFGISGDGWQALAAALAVHRKLEAEGMKVNNSQELFTDKRMTEGENV